MSLYPPVTCLPSPQLTLPEGIQPRCGHTLTACSVCPDRIHTTTFGGIPEGQTGKPADAKERLAETTVMEFGEWNMLYIALYCVLTDTLYIS